MNARERWKSVVLLVCLSMLSAEAWSREYSKNVQAVATQVLDSPFHFLLRVKGFQAQRLVHESDLFSTWGEILLVQTRPIKLSQAQTVNLLIRQAKAKGWSLTNDLSDIDDESRDRFGKLGETKEIELEMVTRSNGQNPPTRYGCKVWVKSDGTRVVAAFRVDSE